MFEIMNLLPVFILVSIALVVVFTELIKKLDKKNWLKGYRVYIPLALSAGASGLLKIGNFFVSEQFWFWWAVIFGFSVFAYEAVLKKLEGAFNKNG
jgi:Na+-translocating ferredoxin:NAD+ oxidoreductase RnfA subunit